MTGLEQFIDAIVAALRALFGMTDPHNERDRKERDDFISEVQGVTDSYAKRLERSLKTGVIKQRHTTDRQMVDEIRELLKSGGEALEGIETQLKKRDGV